MITNNDKWWMAGGLAMALVGVAAAAAIVWMAIDAMPPPLPPVPLHDMPRSVPQ